MKQPHIAMPWLAVRLLIAVSLLALAACGGAPPTNGSAQSELEQGLAAHVAGDQDQALTHYRRALALDPDNKFAYYNIGLIHQLNNRMPDAETNYRAALNIDADYTPALFNLAIVRTQANDLEEAVTLYQRVVALQPERAGAYLNLGLALARLGRTAEAEAALQRAIQLDPNLAIPDAAPAAPTPGG